MSLESEPRLKLFSLVSTVVVALFQLLSPKRCLKLIQIFLAMSRTAIGFLWGSVPSTPGGVGRELSIGLRNSIVGGGETEFTRSHFSSHFFF